MLFHVRVCQINGLGTLLILGFSYTFSVGIPSKPLKNGRMSRLSEENWRGGGFSVRHPVRWPVFASGRAAAAAPPPHAAPPPPPPPPRVTAARLLCPAPRPEGLPPARPSEDAAIGAQRQLQMWLGHRAGVTPSLLCTSRHAGPTLFENVFMLRQLRWLNVMSCEHFW